MDTLQRLKGAIDRTIAEEQARQKLLNDAKPANTPGGSSRQSGDVSRSSSGASQAKRARGGKKPNQDVAKDGSGTDTSVNPDPAVFEAAFVIDDEEPSRVSTPVPPPPYEESQEKGKEKEKTNSEGDDDDTIVAESTNGDNNSEKEEKASLLPPKPAAPELPPDVLTKLRKLEKLEKTYPGWLITMSQTNPAQLTFL